MAFGARNFGNRSFGDGTGAVPSVQEAEKFDALAILDTLVVLEIRNSYVDDVLDLVDGIVTKQFQIGLPSIVFPQHPGFYPGPDTFPNEDLYPGIFIDLHMGSFSLVGDLPIIFEEGIPSEEAFGDLRLDQLEIRFEAGIASREGHEYLTVNPYVDRYKVAALATVPGYHLAWDIQTGPETYLTIPYPGGAYQSDAVGAAYAVPYMGGTVAEPTVAPGPPPYPQVDGLTFSRSVSQSQYRYGYTVQSTQFDLVRRSLWPDPWNRNDVPAPHFSVAAWVKPTDNTPGVKQYIFSMRNYMGQMLWQDGAVMAGWYYQGPDLGPVEAYVIPGGDQSLDQWHHFAISFYVNPAVTSFQYSGTGTMTIWHNGRRVKDVSVNDPSRYFPVPPNFPDAMGIGMRTHVPNGGFRGEVGPVTLWSRYLEDEEVADLFLAGLNVRPEAEGHTIRRRPERRARTDHILMKTDVGVEDSLQFVFHDLESPAGLTQVGEQLSFVVDNNVYMYEHSPSVVAHRIRRIERAGDEFSWDWEAVVDGLAFGLEDIRGWAGMDRGWAVYRTDEPESQFMQAYDVDSPPFFNAGFSPLPDRVSYDGGIPDGNSMVRVTADDYVVARPSEGTGNAPEALSLRWDPLDQDFVVRSQILFGAASPMGGHSLRTDPPIMHLGRVDDSRVIAVWSDGKANSIGNLPEVDLFYAQLIHLDSTTGTLTAMAPTVVIEGNINSATRLEWIEDQQIMLVVGVNPLTSELGARTFGLVDHSIVEIDSFKALTPFPVYTFILVGADGEYAALWKNDPAELMCTRFKIGSSGRDWGAIQALGTEMLGTPLPEEDDITFVDVGVQLSPTEWGVLLEYYHVDTSIKYKYLVATKVDA